MKNKMYLLICLLVLAVGCNSNYVPLKGTVVFSDDETPLTTGSVVFESGVVGASGALNERGEFTIGSMKADDGLAPGTYKVFIVGATKEIEDKSSGMKRSVPLIHSKYDNKETSGIVIEVKKGETNKFEIVVEKP
ncbi:MAG: hypothetical protein LBU65_15615 [Planctomycetaceae bacterium]|jgi:hypothetical protein|nr:hypothetical protein [Planctomycetaceae bacterium]